MSNSKTSTAASRAISQAATPTRWQRFKQSVTLHITWIWFIVGRWQEEPVGVAVPLIAAVLILFAPQMPDMFAGMADAEKPWWQLCLQSVLFGFSALALGALSWFWTRAALSARIKRSDCERNGEPALGDAVGGENPGITWSRTIAPRFGLYCSVLITAAPILIIGGRFLTAAFSSSLHIGDMNWMGFDLFYKIVAGQPTSLEDLKELLGFPLGFLLSLALFAGLRLLVGRRGRLKWHAKRLPPAWMWRFTITSIFAAAPFGWMAALGCLAFSVAGYILVASLPGWLHYINAPAAALMALALLIGPLVVAFAFLRDVTAEILMRAVFRYYGWPGSMLLFLLTAVASYFLFFPPEWLLDFPEWIRWPLLALPLLILLLPLLRPYPYFEDRYRRQPFSERVSYVTGLTVLFVILYGPPITGYGSDYYAVRTTAWNVGELPRPTLAEALAQWHAARRLDVTDGAVVPLIIVATEGGASRAAVWTLAAMRRLDQVTN